jgi:hypothetical protein
MKQATFSIYMKANGWRLETLDYTGLMLLEEAQKLSGLCLSSKKSCRHTNRF